VCDSAAVAFGKLSLILAQETVSEKYIVMLFIGFEVKLHFPLN
jgi:hypothetical protein